MGGSGSKDQGGGFRIFKICANSPAHRAGLEVFFDYIVEADGQCFLDLAELDSNDSFFSIVQKSIGKELKLVVFNARSRSIRDVFVLPSAWGGPGLLGATVRYDTLESAFVQGIRVLDVCPGSPAATAGLIPYYDYLLCSGETVLSELAELVDLVKRASDSDGLPLAVYNAQTETIRECTLVPNVNWGGKGSIGCDIGTGYLHRIPFVAMNQSLVLKAGTPPTVVVQKSNSTVTTTTNYYPNMVNRQSVNNIGPPVAHSPHIDQATNNQGQDNQNDPLSEPANRVQEENGNRSSQAFSPLSDTNIHQYPIAAPPAPPPPHHHALPAGLGQEHSSHGPDHADGRLAQKIQDQLRTSQRIISASHSESNNTLQRTSHGPEQSTSAEQQQHQQLYHQPQQEFQHHQHMASYRQNPPHPSSSSSLHPQQYQHSHYQGPSSDAQYHHPAAVYPSSTINRGAPFEQPNLTGEEGTSGTGINVGGAMHGIFDFSYVTPRPTGVLGQAPQNPQFRNGQYIDPSLPPRPGALRPFLGPPAFSTSVQVPHESFTAAPPTASAK